MLNLTALSGQDCSDAYDDRGIGRLEAGSDERGQHRVNTASQFAFATSNLDRLKRSSLQGTSLGGRLGGKEELGRVSAEDYSLCVIC